MLVLASSSPQRRAILARLGVRFEVVEPDVEELEEGDAEVVARENAVRKLRAVRERLALRADPYDGPVLAADTVVTLDGRLYGKPSDEADARSMLSSLAGRRHSVLGAIALADGGGSGERVAVARTEVLFRELRADLLDWYLATGEWRGRAGGYAIQGAGAALVREIEGDYENVVGLPLARLLDILPALLERR